MNFEHSNKTKELISLVSSFIEDKIKPREQDYIESMESTESIGSLELIEFIHINSFFP